MTQLANRSLAGGALALLLAAALPAAAQSAACVGRKPHFTDPAFQSFTGPVAIATSTALNGAGQVLVVIDLKNQATAPLDANWSSTSSPPTAFYQAPGWIWQNLGDIFGVTLDGAGNLYVATSGFYASTVYPQGAGAVQKIDGATGAISTFANLPASAAALGNLDYDLAHNSLYVTSLDDGLIYRLNANGTFNAAQAFDHGASLPAATPPGAAILDDPGQAATPLGRRVVAVHARGALLYYSVWWEDGGHPDATHANEIWSVGLDGAGNFLPGTQRREITLPPLPGQMYSNPVTDISFGPQGNMLLAERSLNGLADPSAHQSRGFEYVLTAGTWSPSANTFQVGEFFQQENAAGGVAQDFGPGGRVWFSGDALHLRTNDALYGLQGTPATGGSHANSILVDLDEDLNEVDKTLLGDVAIPCPAGSGGGEGFALDVPAVSPAGLACLAVVLGLAGWRVLRARRRWAAEGWKT